MIEKNTKKVSSSFQENIEYMNQVLPVQESFDVIQRDMLIGGKKASFYFIDGFTKDETMLKIMTSFFGIQADAMPEDATAFAQQCIPYVEVDIIGDFDQVLRNILSGVTCLFIDGYEVCIAIDCRTYPARSVEEPDKDKSLRGSRDGFVETIVFNTALMRRRIRDPHLIMEMVEAGQTSRTDIALCYMSDRVDQELLKNVQERIKNLKLDDLRMNQQSLADAMFKRKWFNPFPKFKFTERPDTAAACLLEGKVVIMVDNSPSAMILPTSIFDMIEEANDYYFPTLTGVYLKISRALITILTVFLTPVFLLFMQNPNWLPDVFAFVAVKDTVNIPLIFQLLILELSIDGLRLAALNTPSMLSTPLSVIAGLVMGEFSVKSGWFNSEVMLYMAFVAVANYTQPNFELGYALKFMRLLLLILTACFNAVGFVIGCILIVCFLAFNKTLSGRNYLNIKLQ
ncbi:spore germination protein [Muricomes sp. OA1]|uniref:Spore germination protein n=1 Tax=Hungatella hathewayi TaxID=154046 RepID=A0A3E2WJR9_9FIRM|nr:MULTISPECIES: spore germination protein [Clostridia]MCH1974222.1 spore germination protein [Muricomes sp. OA1]MRM90338.1 spore germination protein [Faecalicatena contorta]RGC27354.1 spore germination protein [Hungatella hathewayi]GKH32996.1 spore germination protein [Faecalicatena contorta]